MPASLRLPACLLLSATTALAQVPFDTTVVLTRTTGPFQSQVLAVSATGTVTPFGRFPSDTLPPQAIEVDPVDRTVLVAVDRGGGAGRVLRLLPGPGLSFSGELPVIDLPGSCEQLSVQGDELQALVFGAGSVAGVHRLPRRGGPATVARRDYASAMLSWGSVAIVGWAGLPMPGANIPGLVHLDLATSSPIYGPFPFANLPLRVPTGLIDLPTALSRQLIALDDGTFWLHVGGLGDPVPVPMTPQPPAGGAAAFKPDGYAFSGLAVGGASFPQLYRADWNGTVTVLATLPGAPVDLAPPIAAYPQVVAFGEPCGPPWGPALQLVTGVGGPPQVGNLAFDVRVAGALPLQGLLFVAGFSDLAGGVLPFVLPGGCLLHTTPDAVRFQVANAGGGAVQALPIPPLPALAGVLVFAQWLQPAGAGLAASPGLAIQIAP